MLKDRRLLLELEIKKAQAMLNISEGIKNGQVQTIVVPSNFNALMMPK